MKRTRSSVSSFDKKEIEKALLFSDSNFDVENPNRRKQIDLNNGLIKFTIHFNVHSTLIVNIKLILFCSFHYNLFHTLS